MSMSSANVAAAAPQQQWKHCCLSLLWRQFNKMRFNCGILSLDFWGRLQSKLELELELELDLFARWACNSFLCQSLTLTRVEKL